MENNISLKGNPHLVLTSEEALLRKEIIVGLSGDAYILYQVYKECLAVHNDMPNDIAVSGILGWHSSKAKRLRDALTKGKRNYYLLVISDSLGLPEV